MRTAILFTHGFMGARRQFKSLAAQLDGCGADLFLHVLPGHEATPAAFRASNERVWQSSVIDRVRELVRDYERVILVGHSMGGLLCVGAAIECPSKISGVIAIAFPIKIRPGRDWLRTNVLASKPPREGEPPRVTVAREVAGVEIKSVGEYLSTLPQNFAFLKAAAKARREIERLTVPLTVINFENDEIVSPAAAVFVRKKLPGARIITLKNSYHFMFNDAEEQLIADLIRETINQPDKGENDESITD